MTTFLSDRGIYERVIRDAVPRAARRVWIATADIKDLYCNRSKVLEWVGEGIGGMTRMGRGGVGTPPRERAGMGAGRGRQGAGERLDRTRASRVSGVMPRAVPTASAPREPRT